MWSQHALQNFSKYLKETPKANLGKMPASGAYDSASGARGHGFGHRRFARGIPSSAFSALGAFDYSSNGEENNGNMSKSGQSLVAIQKFLGNILSDEQMSQFGDMLEDFAHHIKVEALNGENSEDEGELDTEGQDRRRARDNPNPFANGGRPNPGGRVDPADPLMNGRAGDARPRRASDRALASFNEMFGNPSPMKHV